MGNVTEEEREFLADTNGILVDYDGCDTVESLKELIDEVRERNSAMLSGTIKEYGVPIE